MRAPAVLQCPLLCSTISTCECITGSCVSTHHASYHASPAFARQILTLSPPPLLLLLHKAVCHQLAVTEGYTEASLGVLQSALFVASSMRLPLDVWPLQLVRYIPGHPAAPTSTAYAVLVKRKGLTVNASTGFLPVHLVGAAGYPDDTPSGSFPLTFSSVQDLCRRGDRTATEIAHKGLWAKQFQRLVRNSTGEVHPKVCFSSAELQLRHLDTPGPTLHLSSTTVTLPQLLLWNYPEDRRLAGLLVPAADEDTLLELEGSSKGNTVLTHTSHRPITTLSAPPSYVHHFASSLTLLLLSPMSNYDKSGSSVINLDALPMPTLGR